MASDDNHEGRVEAARPVLGSGENQRNAQRHSKCDLHGQPIHRMSLGKAGWPTHEPQEHLGEEEDEHAAKNQDCHAGTKGIPSEGGGGRAPDNA